MSSSVNETLLQKENKRLHQWISDLQSGMYINCVYCGHRYGPKDKVPATMAEVLTQHVQHCPKHPMSNLRTKMAAVIARIEIWQNTDPDFLDDQEQLDGAEDTIMDIMRIAASALKEAA